MKCPKCGHSFKSPQHAKAGSKSKRTDMSKGSPGQIKAQLGRYRAKCIRIFKSHTPESMIELSEDEQGFWFDGKKFDKEGR